MMPKWFIFQMANCSDRCGFYLNKQISNLLKWKANSRIWHFGIFKGCVLQTHYGKLTTILK